jgi:hypothetical protein
MGFSSRVDLAPNKELLQYGGQHPFPFALAYFVTIKGKSSRIRGTGG